MIYSFIHGERIVNLLPISVREDRAPHIYKSDSMTLIVGPNDSGKTELLASLCHSVARRESTKFEIEGRIEDVGIVYFSPAPFTRLRFPKASRRVKVISQRHASPVTQDILDNLKEKFGFSGSVKLRLRYAPEDGVRELLSMAMEIPSKIPLFSELEIATLNYQKASSIWRSEDDSGSGGNRERQSAMVAAQRALKDEIEDLVRARLGPNYQHFLIALAFLVKSGGAKRLQIKYFWNSLAGKSWDANLLALVDIIGDISTKFSLDQLVSGVEIERVPNDLGIEEVDGLVTIGVDGLSSGAEALVTQFTAISSAVDELSLAGASSIIVLIDEGDAFLHLAWQQRYIKEIDRFARAICPKWAEIQVVVATHSPVLMSDFPRDYILRLSKEKDEVCPSPFSSFAAPLEKIVETAAGAGSIGQLAADVIRAQLSRGEGADTRIVEWIDDPLLRRYLLEKVGHAD